MGNSLTSECRDPEQEKNLGRGPPPGRVFDSAASSSSTTGVVRVPTSTRERQLSPTGTGKREQKGRDRDSQPSATDPTSPAAALWAEGRQLCAVNITSDQPEWRQNVLREAGSVRHVMIVGLVSQTSITMLTHATNARSLKGGKGGNPGILAGRPAARIPSTNATSTS